MKHHFLQGRRMLHYYLSQVWKTSLISSTVILTGISINGCKKSNAAATPPESNWTWSLSPTKFVGTYTFYQDLTLTSWDDPDFPVNSLEINFDAAPDSGSYPVISSLPYNDGTPTCQINFIGNGRLECESIGGGTVNVTMVAGKIHASFTGIPMGVFAGSNSNGAYYDSAGTLSGTVIEQQIE